MKALPPLILTLVVYSSLLGGCSLSQVHTVQYPDISELDFMAVVENQEAPSELWAVETEGSDAPSLVFEAASLVYHEPSARLLVAPMDKAEVRAFFVPNGDSRLLMDAIPNGEILDMSMREDGTQLAVLWRSAEQKIPEQRPCDGGFCVLQLEDLTQESTRLITLPQAHSYALPKFWAQSESVPLVEYVVNTLGDEYRFARFGSGGLLEETVHILRPDNELPEIQFIVGGEEVQSYRFDFIDERKPKGWLVFALRSEPRGIIYKFPPDTVIGKEAIQVMPSPSMRDVIIRLGSSIFRIDLSTSTFHELGEGSLLRGFTGENTVVGLEYSDEFLLNIDTRERVEQAPKKFCGEIEYFKKYFPEQERVILNAPNRSNMFIDGLSVPWVICRK